MVRFLNIHEYVLVVGCKERGVAQSWGGMLLETSRGVLACVGMQRSSHDLVFLAQVFI